MDDEKKRKYLELMEKNKKQNRENSWQNNVLFKECMEALDGCKILSYEESNDCFHEIEERFPMTASGVIDWAGVKNSVFEVDISDIFTYICGNEQVVLLWDQKDIPCIRCELSKVIARIDDVLAVSFNTWILSKDKVIEFHHEGKIRIGL